MEVARLLSMTDTNIPSQCVYIYIYIDRQNKNLSTKKKMYRLTLTESGEDWDDLHRVAGNHRSNKEISKSLASPVLPSLI